MIQRLRVEDEDEKQSEKEEVSAPWELLEKLLKQFQHHMNIDIGDGGFPPEKALQDSDKNQQLGPAESKLGVLNGKKEVIESGESG